MHPAKTAALVGALALIAACAKTQPSVSTVPDEPGGAVGVLGDSILSQPSEPEAVTEDPSTPALRVHRDWRDEALPDSVRRGLAWLMAAQGPDGAWGQDGGRDGVARADIARESTSNDVANTAIVALALLRSGVTPSEGEYTSELLRAVEFIVSHVEKAPPDGLAITDRQGTQIQRKLGKFVDTFFATMVLNQVDGLIPDAALGHRVDRALSKCVAKIEAGQQDDGSWSTDGWAPVLSTSMASRSLWDAQRNGQKVDQSVLDRVDEFTVANAAASGASGGSRGPGRMAGSAGVELYGVAQAMEQLSRDGESRAKNGKLLARAEARLADAKFVQGFGSMGGEEFISYMNLSDSLCRSGGKSWTKWNGDIKTRLVKLQNQDGTWAGHHCITGRVACTAAAILTLLAERTVAKAS